MLMMTASPESVRLSDILQAPDGARREAHGMVHAVRDLGDVRFVLLRTAQGVLQCVAGVGVAVPHVGDAVRVHGTCMRDGRAPGGLELRLEELTVLSSPAEPLPVAIDKYKLNLSMDTDLSLRPVTLRNLQ